MGPSTRSREWVRESSRIAGLLVVLVVVVSGTGLAGTVPADGPTPQSTGGATAPDDDATTRATPSTPSVDASDGGRLVVKTVTVIRSRSDRLRDRLRARTDAAPSSGTAEVVGQVMYNGTDGNLHPARRVQVRLKDKDNGGWDWDGLSKGIWGETRTDDRGWFSFTLDATKPDNSNTASLVVQVFANNPAAEVNPDKWGGYYKFVSPMFEVSNGQTHRTRLVPVDTNQPFQAVDYALTARQRIAAEAGGWTRPKVHISWPEGDWPQASSRPFFERILLPRRSTAGWDAGTVYHEYGHRLMGTLYENTQAKWPNYSEGLPGDKDHIFDSETHRGYAWTEGWAEFMEAVVADDPAAPGSNFETTTFYQGDFNGKGTYDGDTGDMDGHRVEGSVGGVLWDLYDGDGLSGGSDDDDVQMSLRNIFRIVNIHDVQNVDELWNVLVNDPREQLHVDASRAELREIYADHGIPRQEGHEGSTRRLAANASAEAQIVDSDADRFSVRVGAGERLTAKVQSDVAFTDLTVEIESPNDRSVATASGKYVASADWVARETGTYTIVVYNFSGNSAPYEVTAGVRPYVSAGDENNDDAASAVSVGEDLYDGPDTTGRETATAAGGYLPGDSDYYELTLAPGQYAKVRVESGAGRPVEDWTLLDGSMSVMREYAPGGEALLANTGGSDRTYYLRFDEDEPIPSYEVSVTSFRVVAEQEDNDDPDAATNLDSRLDGSYASGTNKWHATAFVRAGHQSYDDDYYELTLEKGDHVWAKAYNDSLELTLLYGRYGTKVQTVRGDQAISWTANLDSTYHLKVTGGRVSEHWLQVGVTDRDGYDRLEPDTTEKEATDVPGTDSLFGTSRTYSDLKIAGTDDTFAVDLLQGQQLNATLTRRGDPGIGLSVSGPGSPRTGSYWDDSYVRFTAPQNGTYYLTVSGEDGATAGAYDLSIETSGNVVETGVLDESYESIRNVSDDLARVDLTPGNDTDASNDTDAACGDDAVRISDSTGASDPVDPKTYFANVSGDCPVEVRLTAAGADLDLYVTLDGRTPTSSDFDRRSAGPTANESVRLSPSELANDSRIAVGVDAYSGSTTFRLVVEEVDPDEDG